MDGLQSLSTKTKVRPKRLADWWRGAVIYQIYPRSFFDANDDGVGDLPGIMQKLEYLSTLGVDGIWISPFFVSPMKDFGYDVADYCDVDPIFGTLEDFDALVEKAHALDLKVIIDQVYSHTSDMHPWFVDSRASKTSDLSEWYVWADAKPDGSPPSNWQSVFGGPAWTWDARRGQYYLHNFLPSQPQLNVHNLVVQDALLDIARFWLDRNVDGFRLDAINFAMHDRNLTDNPPWPRDGRVITRPFDLQHHIYNMSQPELTGFVERLAQTIRDYGGVFTVAEVGGPEPLAEMKALTEGENRLSSAYSFDFLYAEDFTPERVKSAASKWGNREGEGWPSWAFSNHDAPRSLSRWHDGTNPDAFAKMSAALLLCLRGNPILYQGDELGLPQAEIPFEHVQDPEAIANWPLTLGRDGARTPLPWDPQGEFAGFGRAAPWLPMDEAHAERAISRQLDDPESVLNFVRNVLQIRSASAALRIGALEFVDIPHPLLGFFRQHGDEKILCVFNIGGDSVAIPQNLIASVPLIQSEGCGDHIRPFGVLIAEC